MLGCPNLSADLERPFTDPDPHGVTMLATADGPVVFHCAAGKGPEALQRFVASLHQEDRFPLINEGAYSQDGALRVSPAIVG